ncbi:MAG TPA: acyl carrier protein [Bryobacteraceae bacterium]|nr:acyl carrier protein [Bryobacteraceae bacterium]
MEATCVSCCSTNRQIRDQLREIVRNHARIHLPFDEINDTTDLYRAGMSSQASVVLMIAVEGEFGIEFPDSMLSRDIFSSIENIAGAVETVMQASK